MAICLKIRFPLAMARPAHAGRALLAALPKPLRGLAVRSRSLAHNAGHGRLRPPPPTTAPSFGLLRLKILELARAGRTNAEISAALDPPIHPNSVTRILRRLIAEGRHGTASVKPQAEAQTAASSAGEAEPFVIAEREGCVYRLRRELVQKCAWVVLASPMVADFEEGGYRDRDAIEGLFAAVEALSALWVREYGRDQVLAAMDLAAKAAFGPETEFTLEDLTPLANGAMDLIDDRGAFSKH